MRVNPAKVQLEVEANTGGRERQEKWGDELRRGYLPPGTGGRNAKSEIRKWKIVIRELGLR